MIRLNPRHAEAYFLRGLAKAALGHSEDAIFDYDEAIRLDPDYAAAYYFRGRMKRLLDSVEDGASDIQMALELAEKAGDEALKSEIMKELSKRKARKA